MKLLKKNQIVVYAIAVLLMVVGYMSYTTNNQKALEVSNQNITSINEYANVGDARLVSSNDVISENINANKSNTTADNSVNQNEVSSKNEVTSETSSSAVSDEYFAKSKLERDTMYSQMLETYEKVLNSNNALETQKQSATKEITKINETKNSIMICENLLQTKGFNNSVIFVNGKSVSIIIGAKELKQEEIAQIQNIISREMKADIENIHISTK